MNCNNTITLLFNWNTTGVPEGTYTVSANATVVLNDYEPYDNTFTDGTVTVVVAVPEFPFGAALEIGLVMVIVYVWWRKVTRKNFFELPKGKTLKYCKPTYY